MKRLIAILFLCLAAPLIAQDEGDKSLLEGFLEDTLSDVGREVSVIGFKGALSSEATMEALTIADDEGVWLRLSGVTLNWTRSALVLSRRLEVQALVAEEIEFLRLPKGQSGPQAQASDFSLPELPVAVEIGRLAAGRLSLGETVLGEAVTVSLAGSGRLADGAGQVDLRLERIDGRAGAFAIKGGYDNETRVAALNLTLDEGAGGIVAGLTGLPGAPPVSLTLAGEDPIDAFTARLALATSGVDRFGGLVELASLRDPERPEARPRNRITADLTGDIRPLLTEEYQSFFGGESRLRARVERFPNGVLALSDLALTTEALRLTGDARLNAEGWPELADLDLALGYADRRAVLLPLSGPETYLDGAALRFTADATRGTGWTLTGELDGFQRDGITLSTLTLAGTGTLRSGGAGRAPGLAGRLAFSAIGIDPGDPDLAQAIGDAVTGSVGIEKGADTPFELTDVALLGADYRLFADVALSTDARALDLIVAADGRLAARDLSRFAPLAGRDLAGGAEFTFSGQVALPDGPFDVTLGGVANDLALGIPTLDGLLGGRANVTLAADRDAARTVLRELTLDSAGARIEASATLRPGASRVDLALDVPDGALLAPGLTGRLGATGQAVEDLFGWSAAIDATGPGGLVARIDGRADQARGTLGPVEAALSLAIENLAPYSGLAERSLAGAGAFEIDLTGNLVTQDVTVKGRGTTEDLSAGLGDLDRLIAGASTLGFDVTRGGDCALTFREVVLATPEVDLSLSGDLNGIEVDAGLRDLSVLVPALAGAATLTGTATLSAQGYDIDVQGAGPGGTTLTAAGRVSQDASEADIAIAGQVPLALANAFTGANRLDGTASLDLRLAGPLALDALSGRVSSTNARIALPNLRVSLDPIQTNIQLAGGRAQVEAQAAVTSGGRIEVSGPITLAAPFDAGLSVRLMDVGLTDPTLYNTTINGALRIDGPLTGGATIAGLVEPGVVEIRIPTSGFGVASAPEGLVHINDSAAVRATRARAAQTSGQGGGTGPAYALDIEVSAPNQVFIRGRGLDAELGGTLRLMGTTQDMRPDGALNLIRGRLTLLGNRIELAEARARLEGDFDPFIVVTATSVVDDVAILIRLEGQATDPVLSLASAPTLPEDEILARLIFGRSLADISPLQALQMANGVATLAGNSSGGLVGRLRESFGLADLDIVTNDGGATALRAGTYLSENVYAGVEVGADGAAEVTLNLDLTPDLTARGSISNTGGSSLGVFFEKDY